MIDAPSVSSQRDKEIIIHTEGTTESLSRNIDQTNEKLLIE